MSLKNKVILLTGASSGIGWETAFQLAGLGCGLALAARRIERLEELAGRLRSEFHAQVLVLPTDVRRQEDLHAMVHRTQKHFGRLDVLINNAGVLSLGPILKVPIPQMQSLMDTNFWSLVHAIRSAAPLMEQQGGGHIVNVGSMVSRRGLPFMGVYCASKFALAGLTESLRVELAAKNIRFTLIYPGATDTEMPRKVDRSHLPEGYPDHGEMRISAQRVARAIVKTLQRPRHEVYVPWWGRWLACASVLCPGLVDNLLKKSYKRAL